MAKDNRPLPGNEPADRIDGVLESSIKGKVETQREIALEQSRKCALAGNRVILAAFSDHSGVAPGLNRLAVESNLPKDGFTVLPQRGYRVHYRFYVFESCWWD